MASSFSEIPVLDLSAARDEKTKPQFLQELRNALLHVGFLYLKNTGIDQETFDQVCEQGIKFFDLPEEEKLAIEMKNKPSFLGYSRVRENPPPPNIQERSILLTTLSFLYLSWAMRLQLKTQTGESSTIYPPLTHYPPTETLCITIYLHPINGPTRSSSRTSAPYSKTI